MGRILSFSFARYFSSFPIKKIYKLSMAVADNGTKQIKAPTAGWLLG